jgi:hypothetical protein
VNTVVMTIKRTQRQRTRLVGESVKYESGSGNTISVAALTEAHTPVITVCTGNANIQSYL